MPYTLRWARDMHLDAQGEVDWADYRLPIQCQIDDTEHEFHAAFLRSIPGKEEEVFFHWMDGSDIQWIVARNLCLKEQPRTERICMLFLEHPGVCTWGYVDPKAVADLAREDQKVANLGVHLREESAQFDWRHNQPPS
ncbi:hypothetical protein J3S85_13975 [Streptomyces lavenduligriseus]|nr:hypothetical protein J3S85_13975 [Streptomyces lavenduligriseus]